MKVFGQLERAQAELLSADPTGAGLINGRFFYNTTTNKLKFYDGAVRSVVSEDGTQTLTNKTLTGNTAANLSPDGVETLTFPTATDTIAVLAAAQTLSNKSLPTINFPHQATPSNPSSGNSKMYVKSDRKAYLLDEEGNEIQIGTGGGGLDTFHIEDFQTNDASDATTGNNSNFLGGGVIAGAVVNETVSPIAGTRSLKFTQSAGSLNDYFALPAFTLDAKQKGQDVGITCYYSYDGADGDIQLVIYDVTNARVLTSSLDTFKAAGSNTRFSTSVFVPSNATDLRIGFQVKSLTNGAVFLVDDLELSTNPFVYKNLSERETVTMDYASGLTISVGAGALIKLGTTEFNNLYSKGNSGLITATQETSSTRFTFNKSGTARLVGSLKTAVSNESLIFYKNGSIAMENQGGAGVGAILIPVEAGDYIEPYYRGSASTITDMNLTVELETYTAENVVTPASGGETVTKFMTFDTSANGDKSDLQFDNLEIGAEYFISGQVSGTTAGLGDVICRYRDQPGGVGNILTNHGSFNQGSQAAGGFSVGVSAKFTATTSSIYFNCNFNAGGTLYGNSTKNRTYIQLTKVTPSFLAAVPVQKVAYVKDVGTGGSSGGSASATTVHTRDLNTVEGDSEIVSLSSNQFTLQAGKYHIEAKAPAYLVNQNQAFIYNVTDSTYDIDGNNAFASASNSEQNYAEVTGCIEITSAKTYELRHYTSAARATNGLGISVSAETNNPSTEETWSVVKITKLR